MLVSVACLLAVTSYFNAGEKYYAAKTPKRSSKKRPKKPPQGRVGDHVLAGGAAFPTISCAGPAALEPKFSGPFMYTPYLAMLTPTAGKVGVGCALASARWVLLCGQKGDRDTVNVRDATQRSRRRSETVATRIVAEKHRNAAIMKAGGVSPAAGRRYSVAEGAGMAKWDHFLHHQAATTGAEARLQATSPTKKGRRLVSVAIICWLEQAPLTLSQRAGCHCLSSFVLRQRPAPKTPKATTVVAVVVVWRRDSPCPPRKSALFRPCRMPCLSKSAERWKQPQRRRRRLHEPRCENGGSVGSAHPQHCWARL